MVYPSAPFLRANGTKSKPLDATEILALLDQLINHWYERTGMMKNLVSSKNGADELTTEHQTIAARSYLDAYQNVREHICGSRRTDLPPLPDTAVRKS